MNVLVLTEETGWYSDYGMNVLAVASSVQRAKELAGTFVNQEHAVEVARVEMYRARWADEAAKHPGNRYYLKTAEDANPMPTLVVPNWEPNPDRPGDWHANPQEDVRWSIFQTTLDELATDGQPAYAANPDL